VHRDFLITLYNCSYVGRNTNKKKGKLFNFVNWVLLHPVFDLHWIILQGCGCWINSGPTPIGYPLCVNSHKIHRATAVRLRVLSVFFWVIPRHLNSEAGELPRRKHTTYSTRRKFEIKKFTRVHPLKTYEVIPHVLTLLAEESDQVQAVTAVLPGTVPLDQRLGGPHRRSGHFGKEKSCTSSCRESNNHFVRLVNQSLHRLHHPNYFTVLLATLHLSNIS
jgi:hypothetical protein